MLRAIGAVVLGYLVMFVVVFTTFTAAYFGMGADLAFQPGTYEISGLWTLTMIVLGLVAAAVGGVACAAVSRGGKAPAVLAGLVVVLGLLFAIPAFTAPAEQRVRTAEVGNLEAMQQAQTPPWVAVLNPVLGAVGVVLGARLKSKSK